jgi:hypothetical protein
MLLGTPVVVRGKASYALAGHMPEFDDLINGSDLSKFANLQKRLVAFNLFHHLIPVGETFVPALLMRRLSEAKAMKAAFENDGERGLADYLTSTPRTTLIEYLTLGQSPMPLATPFTIFQNPVLKATPRLSH